MDVDRPDGLVVRRIRLRWDACRDDDETVVLPPASTVTGFAASCVLPSRSVAVAEAPLSPAISATVAVTANCCRRTTSVGVDKAATVRSGRRRTRVSASRLFWFPSLTWASSCS
jgi:hypothetical protein